MTVAAGLQPYGRYADLRGAASGDRRAASWLMASAGCVGLANYAYSLALVWLLTASGFSVFAAASGLLLVAGTVAGASGPWVLAQEIARAGDDRARRQAAVSFSLVLSLGQALVAALAVSVAARPYASTGVRWMLAASTIAIFASATVVGYLQGAERFKLIALFRILEVASKIAASAALVYAGAGVAGALGGFALGAAVVVVGGTVVMAPDLRLRRLSVGSRRFWARAGALAGIQGGVALVAGMDVILAAVTLGSGQEAATYQASTVLARAPFFVSVALSMAVFTRLSRGVPDEARAEIARWALRLFGRLAVMVVVVLATLPAEVSRLLFPSGYAGVVALLPWTAVAGGLMGTLNLITTFFQAAGRFRRPLQLLGLGLGLQAGALLIGVHAAGARGLAVACVAGSAALCLSFAREMKRAWPGATPGLVVAIARVAAWGLPLVAVRRHPIAWAAVTIAAGLHLVWREVSGGASAAAPHHDGRLRILHLGFEDLRKPGSGGGAIRTHEINRRLARDHDITVLCARYPGCATRLEDGVRYVHIGAALGPLGGRFGSLLCYFAAIPLALRRHPADLVVEDFAAPFSSIAVPWLTRRPVVGVVQWLFAREKARQYKLPFGLVESLGVRSHRRLVAVSDELGAELRRRNPTAEVTTIPNGLDPQAFAPRTETDRRDVLYLGRIEVAQKGLDLLLEAFGRVASTIDADLVVAGDGPDTGLLQKRCSELGITDRVRWLGRVGAERFDLLASAQLVVMPSRYETFGMVAAEALACATPVLAFDIPCLRGLVTERTGVAVPAFDVGAYADTLLSLSRDPERCRRLGEAGPSAVAGLQWDILARHQGLVYRSAVAPEARVRPVERPEDSSVLGDVLGSLGERRARHHGRRPRILLVGNYGNGNTGDDAILARLLQLAIDRSDVTVLSRRPDRIASEGVPAVLTVSRASMRAFLRADALAIGGGGMFGYGMPPLVRLLPGVALVARALGKDVGYVAIGAYEGMPSLVGSLLRLSARTARSVTVRDAASQQVFCRGLLGSRTPPRIVEDPAIGLLPDTPAAADLVLQAAGVPTGDHPLMLSLKPTPSREANDRMVEAMSAAVDWWTRHRSADVVVVALSARGDYGLGAGEADAVLAERLRARIALPERLHVVGPNLQPCLAKAVIGRGAGLVGMRLHAQIFAWSMGCPLLGVSFEAKSDAFLSQVGAPRLALEDIAPGEIVRWMEAL